MKANSILLTIFLTFLEMAICLFSNRATAQPLLFSTITGKVIDAENGEPLVNVNIFLANSTLGAASGADGKFRIDRVPLGAFEMVISHIGYELRTVPLKITGHKLYSFNVGLKPKTLTGEEIQVSAEQPKLWQKEYEKFKKLLMGESENANHCEIANPFVLNFFEDQVTHEFHAFSDSVLVLQNNALGYRLKIIINNFQLISSRLIYSMYIRYEELKPATPQQKERWIKNRLSAYKGSMRHFFAALVKGMLNQEYFLVYDVYDMGRAGAWAEIDQNKISLSPKDSLNPVRHLKFDNYLGVICTQKRNKYNKAWQSVLELNQPEAEIDSSGNLLTGYALTIYGDWTDLRMADFLPLDYQPEKQ